MRASSYRFCITGCNHEFSHNVSVQSYAELRLQRGSFVTSHVTACARWCEMWHSLAYLFIDTSPTKALIASKTGAEVRSAFMTSNLVLGALRGLSSLSSIYIHTYIHKIGSALWNKFFGNFNFLVVVVLNELILEHPRMWGLFWRLLPEHERQRSVNSAPLQSYFSRQKSEKAVYLFTGTCWCHNFFTRYCINVFYST